MSSFWLKTTALVTMIIDHAGHMFGGLADLSFLRLIGRVAFPIYVFCIAEGCRHTRSLERYMLRLGIFALISEIPFNLLLTNQIFAPYHQNVFFTLFFGVVCVWVYERLKAKITPVLAYAVGALPALAANFLHTDYGAMGVLGIYLCYISPNRLLQVISILILIFIKYNLSNYFWAALVSVALICAYNGRRGYPIRLAFYAIYPIHLLVLYGIHKIVMIG